MKARLCYRLEKEVGLGEDEFGNPTETYSCIKVGVNTYELDNKAYKEMQEAFRKITASQMGVDEKYITPITLNEYLDNTEEDN